MALRRACWRRAIPAAFCQISELDTGLEPPPEEREDREGEITPEQLAEIERFLAMVEDAESAQGCDYSDGPMAPNGCEW